MKILVAGDSYCPTSVFGEPFARLSPEHEVTLFDLDDEPDWEPATPSELGLREHLGSPAQIIERLAGHDVLVVQGAPVSDAVLDVPGLRLVCVARGGPVNVDIAAATARGIPVTTTPGKNAVAVAELTIGLMVVLARRVAGSMRHVDAGGDYAVDNFEGARWFGINLEAHTLGLVGFGQVGSRVATRAAAFGMQVVVFDPYVDPATVHGTGASLVGLDELLATSDVVSLHARLTPESRGLLDAARFAAMKPGALLVNTARAELLDEDALLAALASGHLGGAALDIAQPSPTGGPRPLLDTPNVIILNHIGGSSFETLRRGGELAAAEIERYAQGAALVNVANREALTARAAR
ncbi:MAG: NAD(P)-dependent oxidoreductase [Chloroflexota bacterium]